MNLPEALRFLNSNPVRKGESPSSAARSDRMNAIQDAILGLARGDNIGRGKGIRRRVHYGSYTLSADIRNKGGGGTTVHPFQVTGGSNDSGPNISVYPGVIVTTVPKLYGESLTNLPSPVYTIPFTPFSLFLNVTVELDESFRYKIVMVEVVTDNDAEVVADFVNGEVPELKMKWEDIETREDGHFYIKIADINSVVPPGSPPGTLPNVTIIQFLFDSYRSFVIVGEGVVLIA